MRISSKFAFLILGLLVFSIASSALTHSVSGASTQNNITDLATSDMNLTTNNMIQKLDNHDTNVSELQSTNSDPFKEIDSNLKTNISNALKSEDKDSADKDESQSSSSSPQASDSSCANDGDEGCKDDQKSVKKNSDDSKNKDGTVDKEQKQKTRPDVKSIKDKIKSDIKNRFKLPIDIPFP
jgi:type II secretory pathway pseudopilin PulG